MLQTKTTQTLKCYGNYIEIHGKEYSLFGKPLSTYWELIENKPILGYLYSSSPNVIGGYYAKWKLESNKLFLISFEGHGTFSNKLYQFEDYFGNRNTPFFAYWFDGILGVNEGKLIFVSPQFPNTREYYYEMTFKKGILIDTTMIEINLDM